MSNAGNPKIQGPAMYPPHWSEVSIGFCKAKEEITASPSPDLVLGPPVGMDMATALKAIREAEGISSDTSNDNFIYTTTLTTLKSGYGDTEHDAPRDTNQGILDSGHGGTEPDAPRDTNQGIQDSGHGGTEHDALRGTNQGIQHSGVQDAEHEKQNSTCQKQESWGCPCCKKTASTKEMMEDHQARHNHYANTVPKEQA